MKNAGDHRSLRKHVTHEPNLDGAQLTIGVVAARFNPDLTEKMLKECLKQLDKLKVPQEQTVVLSAAGSFELPHLAARLAANCSAVIALGVIIRGETEHHTHIANAAANGLMQVSVTSGTPVIFGILTTDTHEQAKKRVDQAKRYAESAVEMANYRH